jgi:hypothetical protein
MAVPTISAISPNTVHTGGKSLVEISGTNFKVPTLPPPANEPYTTGTPTVAVLFGTEESTEVSVVSATRLFALIPRSPIEISKTTNYGEGSVDVTVRNLDDNGDPIVGEEVVETDGLTYSRVQLATESDFQRLIRQIVFEFRCQMIPNVQITSHTDYDSDTVDAENITDLAELPGIVLVGPTLRENRLFSQNKPISLEASTPGEYLRRRVGYTVDLEFSIVGVSNLTAELVNLMAVVNGFFEKNKYLELLRDPSDSSLGSVQYEMDFLEDGDLAVSGSPNNSNIRVFSGRFVIRGFDMQDLTGFANDQTIGQTAVTDDEGVRLSTYQIGDSYRTGSSPRGSGRT